MSVGTEPDHCEIDGELACLFTITGVPIHKYWRAYSQLLVTSGLGTTSLRVARSAPAAGSPSDLHGERADAAARTVDQDPLAVAQAVYDHHHHPRRSPVDPATLCIR